MWIQIYISSKPFGIWKLTHLGLETSYGMIGPNFSEIWIKCELFFQENVFENVIGNKAAFFIFLLATIEYQHHVFNSLRQSDAYLRW